MTDLLLPIDKLKNVGPRNISRLGKLGIKTAKDLLWHFPVRYENYTQVVPIADLETGMRANVRGEIIKITTKKIFPRRMFVTDALVKDDTGAIKVVWFNQPFIENQLPEGAMVSLAGKVGMGKQGMYFSSPTYEKIYGPTKELKHTSGLVPIYPETEGVTSKYLRFIIKPLLNNLEVPDPLPLGILEKYQFPNLTKALRTIHFPQVQNDADTAQERLAFDDLLLFQLKALIERRRLNQLKSVPIMFDENYIKSIVAGLPFELTKDQKIAAWEILKDIQKPYPMNRLLEGDVGSGKTVVALIAALMAAARGHQSVFMAPTEVLAHQHYETILALSKNCNIKVGLLTASASKTGQSDIAKIELKKAIAKGDIHIIIGTHAVLQKDVRFPNLALVVIDEQHRFGVGQRAALLHSTDHSTENPAMQTTVPHLLSMTATPIPRTLALTIYGDLDISLIKEKPKNRQKIITKIISPSQRKPAYKFLRDEVKSGRQVRQVFVICPRIELADPNKEIRGKNGQSKMNVMWAEVKAVEEEYKKLSQSIFPDLKVAMLHGKMKPKEKNAVMAAFKNRESDILVSTSVIEVGVDVPNATIMMIENAERFGLAQLHQFRGRVGRDEYQSYCLLFTSTPDSSVNQRLKALVECDDGFELAEKDMAIRGPGEFFGAKQSGLPDLAMASLANVDLIKKARFEARALLKEDPQLNQYPLLLEKLNNFQKLTHFE